MSDATNLITAEGLQSLNAELAELEGEGRREIAERIKTAREWGDLKENSEYHDAKNDQAHLETKIVRLREKISTAVVVEEGETAVDGAVGFGSTVVVGDQKGHAGFGMGKAREVPMAIRKAIEQAKKNMVTLNLKGTTIPHQILGRYGSGQVLLKPASEGTGIIAGGPVRAVMEVAGIQNILTKSLGTSNPHNVIKATFDALLHLKDAAKVAEGRGRGVEDVAASS